MKPLQEPEVWSYSKFIFTQKEKFNHG